MGQKSKVLGRVRKEHLIEMQLHKNIDTSIIIFFYESFTFSPGRLALYSNQGNFLIGNRERSALMVVADSLIEVETNDQSEFKSAA